MDKRAKVVISGSTSLSREINNWKGYFEENNYEVLNYPVPFKDDNLVEEYSEVNKNFFKRITETNILFVMNEDKNNISGYVGATVFAEMSFAVALNLLRDKSIQIVILKMPSIEVNCFDKIQLWLKLGCIELYKEML